MASEPTPEAKSISSGVSYIPFGIPGLDGQVRGIPTGSTVLLAGASDAGGDAFTYTSLATLMLAKHRPEMVPNGIARRSEAIPESVTYITLSHDREHVYSELDAVLDGYQFDTLTDNMAVADFSQRFMELLPVPEALFDARRSDAEIEQPDAEPPEREPAAETFEKLLADISDRVSDAAETLIVIDSLTDLERATKFGLPQNHEIAFLMGLREAVVNWGNVAFVKLNRPAGDVRSDELIHGLLHGSVYFYSNDKGFETYRTMRVGSFGGALDSERQTVFESLIGPTGFRAKATKKIGPSNW
ncbi:RAD55 family ATPase [Haloarcula rubripromontorii]|uniref:Chemotaxis protein CheY n=1 Tax=Haloarcula rubripromontorii TaxID=1705562 RepID=A0A0N0BPE6_9EURY|nr:chemotaxis protein CheY [Haloarcula rubripromontorii]KOX93813.1 chemotaxis protein CheY [Haloarcula rubripromontorii]NLV05715.1 chemotaxis protein CheY [Haloarcula rubripromontorii]